MSSTRRSRRSRQPPRTLYDDAKKEWEERESLESSGSSSKKRRLKDEEQNDGEDQEEKDANKEEDSEEENDGEAEDEEDGEDEDDDEEHVEETKLVSKATSAPKPVVPRQRKIQVREDSGEKIKKPKSPGAKVREGNMTNSYRAVHTALTVLAKKVLHQEETKESSLIAALLQAYKGDGKKNRRPGTESLYTEQLQTIAARLINLYDSNPNKVQVDLLNMVFRSVGGRYESLLDPAETSLDDMSDDDWGDQLRKILDDMEFTPADNVLFCADPRGAEASSETKKSSMGPREFRQIYEEFWLQLGAVALSTEGRGKSSSIRFRIEFIRDLVTRLVELIGVDVQDIRAAVLVGVYQLGTAMLQHNVQLKSKIETAKRQLTVAKRNKTSVKADTLSNQVDSWTRTVSELEGMVKGAIMSVFVTRYRDSNPYIRTTSLQLLSTLTLTSPDIFFVPSYLKYFGWMLSDKVAHVREMALLGFLAPFREQTKTQATKEESEIDLSNMKRVIEKFLPRLVDCAIDIDLKVQEVALELLLALLREGFLSELKDDHMWTQVNLLALSPETTPVVRRYALLFVLEQLDAFDEGPPQSETQAVEQISALVHWIAFTISDNQDLPIENVKYELTDLVVKSMQTEQDLKPLTTNWSALLRAVDVTTGASMTDFDKSDMRLEMVKQRVLLRMLVRSVELEVCGDALYGSIGKSVIDDSVLEAKTPKAQQPSARARKKVKEVSSHEELTLSFLRQLPKLVLAFKSEGPILLTLLKLPRYFLPNVFNLSSLKKDYSELLSRLSDVFLESTDEAVLSDAILALACLARSDHARSAETLLVVKNIARGLRDRLSDLVEATSTGGAADMDEGNSEMNLQNSLHMCLLRLKIVSKRLYLGDLLADEKGDEHVEILWTVVAEYLARELHARRLVSPSTDDEPDASVEIPKVWQIPIVNVHSIVSQAVKEALSLLLCLAAWNTKKLVDLATSKNSNVAGIKPINALVIRMRDGLVKLVTLCFEQYIEARFLDRVTQEHIEFAAAVQQTACSITGDLRSLFPKQFSNCKSPMLVSCALTEDATLVGGYVRFLRSQEHKLRGNEELEIEDQNVVRALLLPMARGLTANWSMGNRREAGVALTHLVGSGQEAKRLVSSISRVLKKIEPVRLLEAHMACLRQEFADWVESEPESLSDRPSEKELADFDAAEEAHAAQFLDIVELAANLASSLGVGKLSDKDLEPALLGFVHEGVRFSFSREEAGDEDLLLGARLPFLRVMSKYMMWIRRNSNQKEEIRKYFNEKEADLRNHPEFNEVLEDDIEALRIFRQAGDLGAFVVEDDDSTGQMTSNIGGTETAAPKRGPSTNGRGRLSLSGSISSIPSKVSTQNSLSPLVEEDGIDEEKEESPVTQSQEQSSRMSGGISMPDSTTQRSQHLDDETENSAMDD